MRLSNGLYLKSDGIFWGKIRIFGKRLVGMTAIALEEGTDFDDHDFMQNVAFNMTGRAQQHLARPDATRANAADRYFVGEDFTLDLPGVTNHQTGAVHIAIEVAINLN